MSAPGMRKAALALAAMHPADRRWLFARLPAGSRALLRPLLLEAKPHTVLDDDILQAVLSDEAMPPATELPTPDVLIILLDRFSVAWAARILRGAAHDHVEIYLAACAPSREAAIRRELSRLPSTFPTAMAGMLGRYLADAAAAMRAEGHAR